MSRCKKCTYFSDYPMSCKDCEKNFPSCGFKQKTKSQIKIEKLIKGLKK